MNSHYKDNVVREASYLYNGNIIDGKTIFILRQGSEESAIFFWTSSGITKTTNTNNAMYTENFYENVLKNPLELTLNILSWVIVLGLHA